MNNMETLTHELFLLAIRELAKQIKGQKFDSLYGIPRGGMVVAVYLSHCTGLPIFSKPRNLLLDAPVPNILVVDDICDNGKTLRPYNENYHTAVIYYNKKQAEVVPDFWILEATDFVRFPWETVESAKVDYK